MPPRFLAEVEVTALPGAPLDRMISLSARATSLGSIPQELAAQLRLLVDQRVVAPAVKNWPWLQDSLRVV